MKKILVAILLVILSTSVSAQSAFSSLEEQMNGKEFTAAGLDKLSPEELEALNQWIRRRSVATLDTASPGVAPAAGTSGDTRGFEVQQMQNSDRTPVTSRIVGSFTGWDGNTIFELENGMIWEQDDKDTFYIKQVENPAITIKPHAFKTWRLSVEGYSSECRVKRIQ